MADQDAQCLNGDQYKRKKYKMATLKNVTISAGSIIPPLDTTTPYNTITGPVVFTQVGTHTWRVPDGVTSIQALVVAGGGAGGGNLGGGGGAGGVLYNSSYSVTAGQTLTITVGAGGAKFATLQSGGTSNNGSNSSLTGGGGGTLTAIGGGAGGGGSSSVAAVIGGSGGGASGYGTASGAAGTAGQGNAGGGGGNGSPAYGGGGGGGAGGTGSAGSSSTGGGQGGIGVAYSILGAPIFFAGGGGGSCYVSGAPASGGAGGGGGGGTNNTAYKVYGGFGGSGLTAGESGLYWRETTTYGPAGICGNGGGDGGANTGGGGGGAPHQQFYAGAGGSGVVILNWTTLTTTQITSTGTTNWTCPAGVTSVEVLLVGGGGAGGTALGAGGGGGGVVYMPAVSVTPGNTYPIVVGGGGAAGTGTSTSAGGVGGDGSPTTGFGATAAGGGGGGKYFEIEGRPGGSGGGGGVADTGNNLNRGGRSTGNSLGGNIGVFYGNRGGNVTQVRSGTPCSGAGGGGAGAPGEDVSARDRAGNGGDGIRIDILGTPYYWGGGGGSGNYTGGGEQSIAGSGGRGGGGAGTSNGGNVAARGGLGGLNPGGNGSVAGDTAGGAGGANTGGGGGGGSWSSGLGGIGGSGIAILRYAQSKGTVDNTAMIGYNVAAGTLTTYESRGLTAQNPKRNWAVGGDTVSFDGYRTHTFTNIGTSHFVPLLTGTVEVLVVAGGGGGGVCYGGGGGGGGVLYTESYAVNANVPIAVVVGNGGDNQISVSGNGTNGDISRFGSMTALGGGGGGGNCGNLGFSGGSGGGGSSNGSTNTNGGGGLIGQGSTGGTAFAAEGSGGGGAGGAGMRFGRKGGSGVANNITMSNRYFGGGGSGGGGARLTGGRGGGPGGTANPKWMSDGAPNTGGGGGGSIISGSGVSGVGGSGIVVVRYLINTEALSAGPGRSADTAAPSALAIKRVNPNAPSGYYWIKPAGSRLKPQQVWCDMENNGGGWMLMSFCGTDIVNGEHVRDGQLNVPFNGGSSHTRIFSHYQTSGQFGNLGQEFIDALVINGRGQVNGANRGVALFGVENSGTTWEYWYFNIAEDARWHRQDGPDTLRQTTSGTSTSYNGYAEMPGNDWLRTCFASYTSNGTNGNIAGTATGTSYSHQSSGWGTLPHNFSSASNWGYSISGYYNNQGSQQGNGGAWYSCHASGWNRRGQFWLKIV